MKNMKNYEAPKAEMIELNVNTEFMLAPGGGGAPTPGGSGTGMGNVSSGLVS